MVGLRYAFDTAPPPPPPAPAVVAAPAPLPARSYLVFFDWDKADLTARARQIVAEAAQASTHVQTTRIEVNGYTDNSSAHPGPRGEKYNLGLSLRRANSVKAELVRDGVPATAIDIHGYGEATRWCRPAPTPANPRTVAWKSSSTDWFAFRSDRKSRKEAPSGASFFIRLFWHRLSRHTWLYHALSFFQPDRSGPPRTAVQIRGYRLTRIRLRQHGRLYDAPAHRADSRNPRGLFHRGNLQLVA